MKLLAIILSVSIITFLPLAAFAEGFGNLNINLNDVMVGQRMQEMSQRLNDPNTASMFGGKKHHQKHEKKHKEHKLASLQNADTANSNNSAAPDAVVKDATQMSLTGSIPQ